MKSISTTPARLRTGARYHHQTKERISKWAIRFIFLLIGFLIVTELTEGQGVHEKYFNNTDARGVILDGYDAVAFFTDNKPVKGDSAIQIKYEDATYYFASKEHLDLFVANPEKYKPQFGGWCAYAVSLGRTAPIDVNTFSIVEGRLLLQHNQRAVNGWNKDVTGNLSKADKYWPAVAAQGGKQITTEEEKAFFSNTDADGNILQGYDAVAYFTDNKPVKGNPAYSTRYNGATYWFVSADHLNLFKDSAAKYAPQYGAFCGYAMSLNKLRPIDPTIFQLVNGRLILQHTQDAYVQFNKDVEGNTAKADNYWPSQQQKHAGKKIKYDKPAQPAPDAAPLSSN